MTSKDTASMIRKAGVTTAAVAALLLLGGSTPSGSIEQDRHRQCAELIWEQGGRVITESGESRPPHSLREVLAGPVHCPSMGTNELLYPDSH